MTEKARFQVLEESGSLEIRSYPLMFLATVKDQGENDAFYKLFRFISGQNDADGRLSMTAPVIMNKQIRSERLAMTAPVIEEEDRMSFIMPVGYDESNLPTPLDPDIRIEVVPARKVAVLRFRGGANDDDVLKKKQEILAMVRKKGLVVKGQPFEMYYNGPWTPGMLRHNEVAVEIE
jgi:hypothetical protein